MTSEHDGDQDSTERKTELDVASFKMESGPAGGEIKVESKGEDLVMLAITDGSPQGMGYGTGVHAILSAEHARELLEDLREVVDELGEE